MYEHSTLDLLGKNVAFNNAIIEWKLDQEPQCMICRKQERNIWGGLEVHHMIPRSLAPALREDPVNFLLLCRICHMRCENMHVINEETQLPLEPIDLASQLYFKSCYDKRNHSPKKLKKHYHTIPHARKQKCLG